MNSIELAKQNKDYIVDVRRNLHKIPELGLDLPKTVEYIKSKLDALDLKYEVYEDISSIVVTIDGVQDGKVVAVRADIDGLPIKEENTFDFKSTNENMHACGHDGHASMALGLCKILSENKDKIKGKVKVLFQAGEEYPGGAKPMIDKGALKNPDAEVIIGLHEGVIAPELKKGTLGICYGPMMASMDRFLVEVNGKGGHGACPQNTIDSVAIAAEIVGALHKIISREIVATEPAVLSVTRIHGGFNQNILPDKTELEGTVRATNEEVRKKIARRIEEISTNIGNAYGADVKITYDFKYPALINNKEVTEMLRGSMKKVVAEENIIVIDKPLMGGEDMAYYLKEIPGSFFFLTNPKDAVNPQAHHTSKFDIDEDYLPIGTAVFLQFIQDYLG